MSSRIVLEVCIESVESAVVSEIEGADRIELNSAVALGGLTPTTSLLTAVKSRIDLPIICMVRPRPGDFFYTDDEFELMISEARQLLNAGADGLATGLLKTNGEVDTRRTGQLREVCNDKELVFHRAFDCSPDIMSAAGELVDLGIDRILTSGGEPTAVAGQAKIAELQAMFGHQIEILPGSGINHENVLSLLETTGCSQVHGTFRKPVSTGATCPGRLNFNEIIDLAANQKYESSSEEIQKVIKAVRADRI